MKSAENSDRVYGTFYKYRPFPKDTDIEGWKRLEDMLTNLVVYFPSPGILNDPFDCYPRVELRGEPKEIRKKAASLLESQLKRLRRELSAEDFEQALSGLVLQLKDARYRNEQLFKAGDSLTGVYCMSRRNDSILQWAYYGGDHCGFCLELTIPSGSTVPFDYVAAVEYVSDRESIDVFDLDNDRDFIWRMVRRKFNGWDHECEVRAFTQQPGLKKVAPHFLTGIIFGAKSIDEQRDWVRSQVAKSGAQPRYYKVSESLTHFALTIEPL